MGYDSRSPIDSTFRERSIACTGTPKILNKRIVLAVDEPIFLPKLEDAGTIGPRAKECPRRRNRFILGSGEKPRSPDYLAVLIKQVTAVFEGSRRIQRNTSSRSINLLVYNAMTLNPHEVKLRIPSLTLKHFSDMCCRQVTHGMQSYRATAFAGRLAKTSSSESSRREARSARVSAQQEAGAKRRPPLPILTLVACDLTRSAASSEIASPY